MQPNTTGSYPPSGAYAGPQTQVYPSQMQQSYPQQGVVYPSGYSSAESNYPQPPYPGVYPPAEGVCPPSQDDYSSQAPYQQPSGNYNVPGYPTADGPPNYSEATAPPSNT